MSSIDNSLSNSSKSVKLTDKQRDLLQALADGGEMFRPMGARDYGIRTPDKHVISANQKTYDSLRKRGLVRSYHITDAGKAALEPAAAPLGNAPTALILGAPDGVPQYAPTASDSDRPTALTDDYDYGFMLDINEVPIPAWIVQYLSTKASASFHKLIHLSYVEYGILENKYELTDAGRAALKAVRS